MQLIMLHGVGGMCPMRSPVPVPVPVPVRDPVSSAVGVRSGSHFRCRQTWKPVAVFALRNGSPDRHNYNYTCIHIIIIIIIIIIKGGNTLWQRGNWWQSTNKAPRWEPKNLLPQHLELGWHRVHRVGGLGSGASARIRSTACIRNLDNLARQISVKNRMPAVALKGIPEIYQQHLRAVWIRNVRLISALPKSYLYICPSLGLLSAWCITRSATRSQLATGAMANLQIKLALVPNRLLNVTPWRHPKCKQSARQSVSNLSEPQPLPQSWSPPPPKFSWALRVGVRGRWWLWRRLSELTRLHWSILHVLRIVGKKAIKSRQ